MILMKKLRAVLRMMRVILCLLKRVLLCLGSVLLSHHTYISLAEDSSLRIRSKQTHFFILVF